MATLELAHFGIGFFPVGLFCLHTHGRVGKHGPVEHGGHRSRRVDQLPRARRRSSWLSTRDLRGTGWGEKSCSGNREHACQRASKGMTIEHEQFSKKIKKTSLQGLPGQLAADVLWALESGNGWFETARRLCAGKGDTDGGRYAVERWMHQRNAGVQRKRRRRAQLACAARSAIRSAALVLRTRCITRTYRVGLRMTHTVRIRRACACTVARSGCCCDQGAGHMPLHHRSMLCRRRHRHHVPRPSTQRRESNQKDEEPVAHGYVAERRLNSCAFWNA